MALDETWIGRKGGRARIVVERSATSNFAKAVKDFDPVYGDARAAEAAGFDAIPAPPTFLIGANHWGTFAELQPEDPGVNPVGEVVGEYARMGGLLLHGEQAFTYHRQVKVGDVLDVETELTEVYDKDSGSSVMTFAVAQTTYTDAETGAPVVTARGNFINRRPKA
jgi:acyl dehydratase